MVLPTCDSKQQQCPANDCTHCLCCPDAVAGNLILCEPTIAAREATAAKVAAETGAVFVPPYDYGPVIAGQGTIGLELLQQVRAYAHPLHQLCRGFY
jgi:hypothetical protein